MISEIFDRILRLSRDSIRRGATSCRHLAEALPGQRLRVAGIDLPPQKAHRLLEMGFVPGTSVEVVRFAPLGDPIEVRVRGYHLSVRRVEARGIGVEEWK